MEYHNIIFGLEDSIATITFNRPKALNAMNAETVKELLHAATACKNDPNVKVLIVTGSGEKAFVAGADISQMQDMKPVDALSFMELGHETLRLIETMPKPAIAAINGFALGGGQITALRAYEIGLVNRVLPPDQLLPEAQKFARKLTTLPGFALKMAKHSINFGYDLSLDNATRLEAQCCAQCFSTDDQKEGMKAFLEKRKPAYIGR